MTHEYDIDTVIARTAHSLVCAAHHRSTAQRVVVKLPSDERGAAALRREVDLLRSLSHPHVIAYVDGDAGERPWLVTATAASSLESLMIAGVTLTDNEVGGVLLAIAPVLLELEQRQLVHGDVKPANILFASDGRPLLADFGSVQTYHAPAGFHTDGYFVAPTILGDVASLARAVRPMMAQPTELRAVVDRVARDGASPAQLIGIMRTIAAHPCWPTVDEGFAVATGPSTREYGPRPPQPAPSASPARRRRVSRVVVAVVVWLLSIAALQLLRDHRPVVDPPAATHQSG
jgi:serine/threonine protein kinase